MSIARTRLSSKASRDAALEAARALLIEEGPQAVTLKAVATRIGKSHATLLHHFGTAAALQSALAASLAEEITGRIAATVLASKPGEADAQAIVRLAFDAFAGQGGGALAAWMIASGDRAALDPVLNAVLGLVEQVGDRDGHPVRPVTLALTLLALGDALLGQAIADALGLPRETARVIAARLIKAPGVAETGPIG